MLRSSRSLLGLLAVVVVALTPVQAGQATASERPASVAALAPIPAAAASTPRRQVPRAGHVFVINIENKGFDATWGPGSKAPYLATTLRRKGVLLTDYYGTAHNSQPNYVAQISGQGPNPLMQADCQTFSDVVGLGTAAPGQLRGAGCVFPASVQSLPTQLTAKHLSWRGYMDDMDGACEHPAVGAQDQTQKATVGHQYAARHDPFVYFHAIIDNPAYCARHVVPLTQLPRDLRTVAHTPHLAYITPDLCNDGHDAPCVDGRPGGLTSVDAWMKRWVPRILRSPAFGKDGVLVITADESDGPQSDAGACCGETAVNTLQAGITGPGGGRIGALVISRWTRPGTRSTTPYNHYSLLASLEQIFGVPRLGYAAQPGLHRFGRDVYNGWRHRRSHR